MPKVPRYKRRARPLYLLSLSTAVTAVNLDLGVSMQIKGKGVSSSRLETLGLLVLALVVVAARSAGRLTYWRTSPKCRRNAETTLERDHAR